MSEQLVGKGAVVAITRGHCRLWAVSDLPGSPPVLVDNRPDDQARNHFKQVQHNRHHGTDVFDRWYLDQVADLLEGARQVLLLGHGHGKGSELAQFQRYLAKYRPAIAQRVIGAETLNLQAMTDGEILATAKSLYQEIAPQLHHA